MIAFLARPGRAQNIEAAQLMLQRMVDEAGTEGLRSRVEAARVIGMVPDMFDRELRKLLEDDAPEVAREAVRAAGLLAKRPLAHRLIDRIAEPWLTDDIVEALARMGDRVVGTIRDQLVDRDTPAAIRRELQRCCRRSARRRHSTCSSRACSTATRCCARGSSRR